MAKTTRAESEPEAPAAPGVTDVMGEMLKTMQKMQTAANKEPALPQPGLFEAKKGQVVVDSQGRRARYGDRPDGKATLLDDDDNPIRDDDGNLVDA